jgi:hypothetical protein
MIQDYQNLGGMKVVLEDGVLKPQTASIDKPNPNAPHVLLIGKSIDGPKGVAVNLTPSTVSSIIGGSTNANGERNGADLPLAAEAIFDACGENVNLSVVRMSGENSKLTIQGAPKESKTEEIHSQSLGVANGYEVDLTVAEVVGSSLLVKATNKTTGKERAVSKEKYSLIPKKSKTKTDMLIVNGTAFNTDEELKVYFRYINKVGDAVKPADPIVENDLTISPIGQGFSVVANKIIYQLTEIAVEGNKIDLSNVSVVGESISFPSFDSVPKVEVNTISTPPASGKEFKINQTEITGKTIVKIPHEKGIPQGKIKVYHSAGYPLTGGVIVGDFDVLYNSDGKFYYIDLTSVADKNNFAETVSSDEENMIDVKFIYIPKVTIKYYIKNGEKEKEIKTSLSEEDRFMEFSLEKLAKDIEKLYVYIDGAEILNRTAIKLTKDNKLKIGKFVSPIGSSLEVTYAYDEIKMITPYIQLETTFAGNLYNQTSAKCEEMTSQIDGSVVGNQITISKPLSKRGSITAKPNVFDTLTYDTFGKLVEAINSELDGFLIATTNSPEESAINLESFDTKYFSGGDDGIDITKEEMFKALSGVRDEQGYLVKQGIYQLIEGIKADYIVPLGVFADEKLPNRNHNFVQELAMCCASLSASNRIAQGFITTKEIVDKSLLGIKEHAAFLTSFSNDWFVRDQVGNVIKDSKGVASDIGKYITIIGGPRPRVSSRVIGTYKQNPALMLVALQCLISTAKSGTNKILPKNVVGLDFNFTKKQVDSIIGNRISLLTLDEDNDIILADGCNSALTGSKWGRVSSLKSVRKAIDVIRTKSKPYLGDPITVEDQNTLTGDIDKGLQETVQAKDLAGYSFQLLFSKKGATFKTGEVELKINTFDELKDITVVVSLA